MLEAMWRPRFLFPTVLLVSICATPGWSRTQKQRHAPPARKPAVSLKTVTLMPERVESGSPELITVRAPQATAVDGQWLGHAVQFLLAPDHRTWFALAGVDVETPAGPAPLKVSIHLEGSSHDVTEPVQILPAHYRTGSLSVAPKFVEPGPEALKQINDEAALKKKVFASTAEKPLWAGDFKAPVPFAATDSFGTRRMFNGKLASIHKGTDFRAPSGTPVLAGNAGRVVLAQPLYYEGNCVIIDHGLGLMSYSMHLSRIDVKVGESVSKGQRVGLSGATGRVTGPHLHWAIRWQGAMLDPAKLLKLDLDRLR